MRAPTINRLLSSLVMAFAVLAATALAAVDFTYPDSDAGRAAEAFITAMNSGDVEKLAAFQADHRPAAQLGP